MRRYFIKIVSAFLLAGLVYFIGMQQACQPNMFTDVGALDCSEFSSQDRCISKPISCAERPTLATCQKSPAVGNKNNELVPKYKEYEYYVSSGKVDILFVIDNSSSMAEEHKSLADQFNSFLGAIQDVDYHIAVITTDISSSPENHYKNEDYQDGKFILIGGKKFLTNENMGSYPTNNLVEDFKNAIQREETIKCDRRNTVNSEEQTRSERFDELYANIEANSNNKNCPSFDERGTYAAYLSLNNSEHKSFFRAEAHFMIVILSDEDIRSGEEFYNESGYEMYQLEDKDEPETLVEAVFNKFSNTKSFSVYSIIIPPEDNKCLDKQNQDRDKGKGGGRGYYGKQYARLSMAEDFGSQYPNFLKGKVISICSRNYTSQLKKVAISAQTRHIPLPCPKPEEIELFGDSSKIAIDYVIEGLTLKITPKRRSIPLSSELKVKLVCPIKQ